MYIFAYGSLMCPNSCSRTLKRIVSYLPATLNGFERKFTALGSVYHNDSKKNIEVRFANLIKNSEATCYGLLFEVSSEELEELIKREKTYEVFEVSDYIQNSPGKVLTFISPEKQLINNGFVLQSYVNIMLLASKNFPFLIEQIEKEYKSLNPHEIINGGFLSITGNY